MSCDSIELSIVIPVYNEAAGLEHAVHHISEAARQSTTSFEVILVDDGSQDGAWDVISSLSRRHERIHGYRLSRNFGKEAALMAGIHQTKGKAVLTIDADLQHPPECIPEMVNIWRSGEWDVVEGIKTDRTDPSPLYALAARCFYGFGKLIERFPEPGSGDFKLMDRKVVEALKAVSERQVFFRGIHAWLGFRRYAFPFQPAERGYGSGKWSLGKLMRLANTGIASFTAIPLQITSIVGVLFWLFALILGSHTLWSKWTGSAVSGFTTVILLQLICCGAVLLCLGIIGTYLGHIFDEVKGRPRYIIAQKTETPINTPEQVSHVR